MDAILIDVNLELNVYVLHHSENIKSAQLLVTAVCGKGERAVCIADTDYQDNTIFKFLTTDNYTIHAHKDYVTVIEKVNNMLYERYGE